MIHPLFQAILDKPKDHFLKTVYADFLQDEGKEKEAKAWRWIAKNGKYPLISKTKWCWDSLEHLLDEGTYRTVYPEDSYHYMPWTIRFMKDNFRTESPGTYAIYYSQESAYLNLVRVLVENPQLME